ncbi:glutamate ABC transporter ATP-binding protein, partial [Streptomyces rubellomurinus subsp. indigoferus]
RVASGRALTMTPQIMFFCEPTSARDSEMVSGVLAVMRQRAADCMTMVVVTHEMCFARSAANRVLFMADGRFVEQNAPDAFFTAPRSDRAKDFLSKILHH